jgi:hypothetical protein
MISIKGEWLALDVYGKKRVGERKKEFSTFLLSMNFVSCLKDTHPM